MFLEIKLSEHSNCNRKNSAYDLFFNKLKEKNPSVTKEALPCYL